MDFPLKLRMIAECRQVLKRSTCEADLLDAVCRIVVQVGGYRMASVAHAEHDQARTLRPLARAGNEQGHPAGWSASWADDERGQGAEGTAIRHQRPCVIQNLVDDPRSRPWREQATERGFAAQCALPLALGEGMGVLSIYAAATDAFEADEVLLLGGLADDLACAIRMLRMRIEHQGAERALHDSEARYRLLFDQNPHPMWVYDLQTLAFLAVNEAAVVHYGYSREEFLQRTIIDLYPGDELPLLVEDVVEVEEGSDETGFSRHLRQDGSLIDVEIISHRLSFEGRPAAFVLATDITQHRRSEQALLQSELKYRELVENINSIILRWSPSGEIIFINDFGLQFFGYSREEMLGRQVLGTIVPAAGGRDLRQLIDGIRFRPERFAHYINENMRRGGERVWVSWTNRAVVNDRGQVVEVFSVGSDVSERMRVEEEVERYREHLEELVIERTSDLQRANAELRQAMGQLVQTEKLAALGNLVAGVAHELNTPLGNIRLVASLLGAQWREFARAIETGKLSRSQVEAFLERGNEAVDLLERNSARAADLIGHFKQVAVDQSSARRRAFDLRQTVEEMLLTLRSSFKGSACRIALEIPAGLQLDSYPGPLEQVIANLVGNSLTHGFAGIGEGCITLLADAGDPGQVVLRYVDDGVGMPQATLGRIFEPFFTTRLGQGGSGLGLYIVYNLVTGILGGTIQVDSSPGHGATFTLTLPRRAPDRQASP